MEKKRKWLINQEPLWKIWEARTEKGNTNPEGEDVMQKISKAHEEWINSLEEDHPVQNYSIQENTSELDHLDDVDIRIYCDGTVNKEENKLDIGPMACKVVIDIILFWQKSQNASVEFLQESFSIFFMILQKTWRKVYSSVITKLSLTQFQTHNIFLTSKDEGKESSSWYNMTNLWPPSA